jgi:hypothetical protein
MLKRTVSQESATRAETGYDEPIYHTPNQQRIILAGACARRAAAIRTAARPSGRQDATAGLRTRPGGYFDTNEGRAVSPEPSPSVSTPDFLV